MSSQVVTRFAPSPTGFLHIGGARTALFNWLYAKHTGGKFLLRIEDTDRERSSEAATQAILEGMAWLGLEYDGEAISQFERAGRHAQVAHALLAEGKAYKCFSSQEEIQAFRETAKAEGRSTLFRSPWRDADPSSHPDAPYVVRIKAPREGETIITDRVQGDVKIRNDQLDDMVLLRSDGTPVYMLAVAVDDHDMGVTHVIRGDDHLNNAARQMMIYHAMGWALPTYAHIPLIHGPDGKKMSKRHGALGVDEYQKEGYPAAGMRNYLARLGWSHGDDEFFTDAQAQEWFDLDGIGKSPARFDFKKLANICKQHMAAAENAALLHELEAFLAATGHPTIPEQKRELFEKAMSCLKDRVKIFPELIETAEFILADRPIRPDEKANKSLDFASQSILSELTPLLQNVTWTREELETAAMAFAEARDLKFGKLAGPLRAALAGRSVTPSVFDMMLVLGKQESLARISDAASQGGDPD
ncbi:MAG: glutamate--tRNA ligase [Pseudomonadota bacterium]